ncbi:MULTISPECIES: phage tail tape measure protein [Leuconostoc]|uniref:phage tail tape measure protein n=1 Tax=Leuconostoc TaxID=1243 RepID=UPI0002737D15|nr:MULTISPECIES: phage tail tape measure protein [Leuconostoc]OQJ68950.1 phage tail tape measure protein [Leuconostoc pseudomesenteroides]CCJ66379.1 Phage tape measure [Leuconostoc pseudomesenteroides 4882]OQJ70181.1 phage tail tape measure protein [Leuconostoc pseudomesenteroides]OQJ81835.1 phage tail tape measure protein [Leuconostoc pseudomesenteroides]ORI75407.1 phage tail tape measure protein [Leuconostoc pseudomesenteroides]
MESYSVQAVLSAVDKNLSSTFGDAAQAASGFESKSTQSLANVGKFMAVAGAGVTAIGIKSVKSFGDFQSSLNKAAVIAGGTSKDIQGLADVANHMGAVLPLSAKDAADAMVAMARDGASISTIKKEFPAIAEAATAAGADLQTTASVVQQSMNIWGDSLKSPQRAAAILTQTANLSNASIEDMQQALATIGGTASNAGIDMATTSTAIGLLTNKGFSAAQASQDLNHALLLMQAPSKMGKAVMEDLGVSMTDAQGNMKPLPTILNELSDSMSNMTSSEKAAALKTMFGTSGMAAILPLMKSVKDTTGNATTSWSAFTDQMNKASSSTQTATKFLQQQASEMQKNLGSKIEQVGGNWESLSNKAAAGSAGVTGGFLDMTNGALDWAANSKSPFADFTRQMVGLAPVIGPATTATGAFLTSAGRIGSVIKGSGKAILGVGKSIVSYVAKLMGIATGNTTVAATSAPAAAGTKAVGKGAQASAKSMLALGTAILEMGAGIALATGGIALLVLSITKLAKTGMSGIAALTAVTVAVSALVAVFAIAGPALTAGAVGIGVFGAAVLGIGVGIGAATTGISLMIDAFVELTSVSGKIVPTFKQIGLGIVVMVKTVLTNIPIMAAMFATGMLAIVGSVTNAIPKVLTMFLQMITGVLAALTTNIPIIVSQFTDMILSVFSAISDNAPRIVAGFAAMLGQLGESIIEITPYVFQLAGALMAGMIAVVASFSKKFQAIGGVVLKSLIAGITGKKYDAMAAATDILNSSGKSASQAGMAAFNNAGGQSAVSALNAISRQKGGANSAGASLGRSAADGICSQSGNASSAGSSVANATKSGVQGISLWNAGSSIISSFLSGLMSGWGPVTSFVGSIAGWIARHKGPIQYDRKLLIPAGNAIMTGLNAGLVDNFKTVQKNVSGMAGSILDAATSVGNLATNAIGDPINALNNNIGGSYSSVMTLDHTSKTQPANITIGFDKHGYTAYVDDINNQQGKTALLKRNNSVQL